MYTNSSLTKGIYVSELYYNTRKENTLQGYFIKSNKIVEILRIDSL